MLMEAVSREDPEKVTAVLLMGATVAAEHIQAAIAGSVAVMDEGYYVADGRRNCQGGDPGLLSELLSLLLLHYERGHCRQCVVCLSSGTFLPRQPPRDTVEARDIWALSAKECASRLARETSSFPPRCPYAEGCVGRTGERELNRMVLAAQSERLLRVMELQKMVLGLPRRDWGWTHSVTLSTNARPGLERGREIARDWLRRLDRKVYPKRQWHLVPREERPEIFLVPEVGHVRGCLHYHGMISAPSALQERLERHAGKAWRRASTMGSALIEPVRDLEGWLRYCLTEWDASGRARRITRYADDFLIGSMLRG
jgi:hypothetical protein